MNPKTQALIARTALGFVLVALPIATVELSKPVPDWRLMGLALLGALAAYLEKNLTPQIADHILPGAVVMPPKPEVPAPPAG